MEYRLEDKFQEAIEIYLFLASGDNSLDAGYLAVQLAQCYEQLGRLNEARYWGGRAVEENPTVSDRIEINAHLGPVDVDHLIPAKAYTTEMLPSWQNPKGK